ncbi:MAG: DUF2007 domain-containing protein [Phycisphaeraceae bacterium]
MTTEDFDVNVYEAAGMGEAEMVHQALENEGIQATIDQIASPFDGLTSINQGTSVLVRKSDADRATEIVRQWMAENHYSDEEEE